jgi:HD-GYP domain-containing protein (c-di-GMP phosphodiesterase class II)
MLVTHVDPASLMPIAVETILCGESFDFELYLRESATSHPVLYRGKSFPIQSSDLKSIAQRGIRTLYIAPDSLEQYEQYLRERVLADTSIGGTVRFCALKEANRSVFLTALNGHNVSKVVHIASDMAKELAEVVCNQEGTVENLFRLLSHDYYTYTHVTNVCVYSLTLAKKLGISNTRELAALATGALLHDVGKRHIPTAILNKKGKLTDQEFAVIKKHPLTGFHELCRRADLTWAQLMMVYQHHERIDGRGYPVGIVGDQIHEWGKLCAIADVFDALSSYRPYRGPMAAADLREFFSANAGTHFDAEMVRCWDTLVKRTRPA